MTLASDDIGHHISQQYNEELRRLLDQVQEMGRLVKVKTPHIDGVLGLVQQLWRSLQIYPTFPNVVANPGLSPKMERSHPIPA